MKSGFYKQPVMTSSVVGLRSSKALLKARLAPRKGHVTVWWSAAHLTHYSFQNPSETITSEKYAQQINEMHRKLQCLQLALVSRMDLTVLHDNCKSHNQHFKRWTNWPTKCCFIHHIHLTSLQPATTSPSILTILCRGKCFPNQKEPENAFQWNLEPWIFMLQE